MFNMIIVIHIYRYSCDEGMSWSDFSFTNTSVTVWGVITEPGQTTTQVLLVTQYNVVAASL